MCILFEGVYNSTQQIYKLDWWIHTQLIATQTTCVIRGKQIYIHDRNRCLTTTKKYLCIWEMNDSRQKKTQLNKFFFLINSDWCAHIDSNYKRRLDRKSDSDRYVEECISLEVDRCKLQMLLENQFYESTANWNNTQE